MARPKSFDEDTVLDAATECFRRQGLNAASIRDLAEEMGIAGPSLYNAFGCKRALFIQALERYANCGMRSRFAELERRGPKAAPAAARLSVAGPGLPASATPARIKPSSPSIAPSRPVCYSAA